MSRVKCKTCPVCNKPCVTSRKYSNGEAMYIHKQRLVDGEFIIHERCDIGPRSKATYVEPENLTIQGES